MSYRRGGSMPFTETYFTVVVLRAIFGAIGRFYMWVVLIGGFLTWTFVKDSVPDDYSDLVMWSVIGAWAVGLPVLLVIVLRAIGRRSARRERDPAVLYDRQVAKDQRLGWISNPPPGQSFFRADGERKRFDHATGMWS